MSTETNIVVIFGAGASFDCIPGRPGFPLTKDLFNQGHHGVRGALESFPLLNGDLADIALKSGPDLEAYFDSVLDETLNKESLPAHKRKKNITRLATMQYYLQRLSQIFDPLGKQNNSNYTRLLEWLDDQDAISKQPTYISFNYDTIFDYRFSARYSFNPNRLMDYLQVKFIKPHGSSNWFTMIACPDNPDKQIVISANAEQLLLRQRRFDEIQVSTDATSLQQTISCNRTNGKFENPTIILPVLGKFTMSVYEHLKPVFEAMKTSISEADQVLIIGYRARDKDMIECFQNIPAGKSINVSVVGTQTADVVQDDIVKMNASLYKGFVEDTGFSGFIEKLTQGLYEIQNGLIYKV
jgi:hypothetical protein